MRTFVAFILCCHAVILCDSIVPVSGMDASSSDRAAVSRTAAIARSRYECLSVSYCVFLVCLYASMHAFVYLYVHTDSFPCTVCYCLCTTLDVIKVTDTDFLVCRVGLFSSLCYWHAHVCVSAVKQRLLSLASQVFSRTRYLKIRPIHACRRRLSLRRHSWQAASV